MLPKATVLPGGVLHFAGHSHSPGQAKAITALNYVADLESSTVTATVSKPGDLHQNEGDAGGSPWSHSEG